MVQTLFCLYLQHPGFHLLAVYFDTMMENLIKIVSHLKTDKIKATHNE